MKFNHRYLLGAALCSCLTSCVSSKRYKEALQREQDLRDRNGMLKAQMDSSVATLNEHLSESQNENGRLINQIDAAGKNASELSRLANMTQQQLQEEQQRLAQMRQLMDQQRQAIEGLRTKMTNALVNF